MSECKHLNYRQLFNQLFGLEELSEVENLPGSKAEQAAHGEEREVKDTRIG